MRIALWGVVFQAQLAHSQLTVHLSGHPTSLRMAMALVTVLWTVSGVFFVRVTRRTFPHLRTVWQAIRPLGLSWTMLTMVAHNTEQLTTLEDWLEIIVLWGGGMVLTAFLLAQAWVQVWH